MREETLLLLEEFAAAWARGETPDPRELLARAPAAEQDELARALDRYLVAAPPRAASEESRAFVAAIAREAEPPLLALRLERRLTRDALVDRLMELLGLRAERRAKVRRYVSDLEVGVLDPAGVAASVWDALGQVLGANVRALAQPLSLRPAAPAAFYRVAKLERVDEPTAPAPESAQEAEPDEVDRLFTGAHP